MYIGFGSMTGFAPEQLAKLVGDAVKRAGVRAVVSRGWLGLSPEQRDDIHVIDEVPHDWLFPRMSAVVHHGGVGTFHEGLRAGKPTVIAAFFGDQNSWGWLNHRIGAGPRALKRGSLSADGLARAIRAAIDEHAPRAADRRKAARRERRSHRRRTDRTTPRSTAHPGFDRGRFDGDRAGQDLGVVRGAEDVVFEADAADVAVLREDRAIEIGLEGGAEVAVEDRGDLIETGLDGHGHAGHEIAIEAEVTVAEARGRIRFVV